MSATGHLLRAELQQRRRLLPLALACGLLAPWLSWALDAAPPLRRLSGPLLLAGGPREQALQALLLLALGWVTAWQAFAGQREEGHPDQLLAWLPLPAGAVFRVRLLSCGLVLLLALLLRAGLGFVCGALWAPGAGGAELLRLLVAEAGLLAIGLGLGLRLGRWGALGWAVLALLALGGEELARLGGGGSLLGLTRSGPSLLLSGLALWAIPALAGAVWARVEFLRPATLARPEAARSEVAARPARLLRAGIAVCATLALVASERATPAAEPRVRFNRGRITTRTSRYLFVGLAPMPAPARALVADADRIHDRVAALLGLSLAPGERLRADLVEEGAAPPGRPGAPRASWSPFAPRPAGPPVGSTPGYRGYDGLPGPSELPASGAIPLELDRPGGPRLVLAAVTAEVLLDRRAGGRRDAEGRPPAWGVLRAGLIRHVSWRAAEVDPFWSRFHAAVLHARRAVTPRDLFDPVHLERTRGKEAAAALGEAVITALTRRQGDAAIPRLVAALCEEPGLAAPQGPGGWEALFQRVGLGADELQEALLELLEDDVPTQPRAQVPLPRLHGMEEPQDQPGLRLVVVPDQELPVGWEVLCRVQSPGEPPQRAVGVGRDAKGCWSFSVPEISPWTGELPRVQMGLAPPRDAPFRDVIWEEWASPQ